MTVSTFTRSRIKKSQSEMDHRCGLWKTNKSVIIVSSFILGAGWGRLASGFGRSGTPELTGSSFISGWRVQEPSSGISTLYWDEGS